MSEQAALYIGVLICSTFQEHDCCKLSTPSRTPTMAAQLLEEAGSTEAAGQDDDADSETPHVRQKDIESSDYGDEFDE